MAAHFITEQETLATELLHELKASAKRWFIAFCVMVILEVATIAGFLWYVSLSAEEYNYTEQYMDGTNSGTATQNVTTP